MQPYICTTCDEHRDATESPPTATMDGELACDTCPEPTTPASRIMRERDEAKQAWAQEYTRANLLEASLERSQQATEDWRAIALQNGEELAKARVECERQRQARVKADRRASEYDAAHETLCELLRLDEIGEDCPDCRGTGSVYETDLVASGGRPEDFTEKAFREDCENCFQGRLPRDGVLAKVYA